MLCNIGIIGSVIFISFMLISLIKTIKLLKDTYENENYKNICMYSLMIQIWFLIYGYSGNGIFDINEMYFYVVAIAMSLSVAIDKHKYSGGLFSALATVVIAEGGVCYGAGFIDNFNVAQIRVDDISDLYKLQGSKYVQSKVEHSYELVESDLRNKKKVLYSGTSCIIAGLLAFLSVKKVSTVGLITCDLICHGVPSPLLWKNNIERQTKKYGEIQSVNFRDKKNGWHSHIESYAFKNGKIIDEKFYTDLFYSHVALRKSCYECRYIKNEEKPADITMADFWGITEATIDIEDDNTGISLAVLRTDKGEELLRKSNLLVCNIDAVSAMVNNMNSPAKPPIWKEKFWRDYKAKGYEYCLKKYSIYGGLWFKIKRRVLKKMGKW